MRYSFKSRQDDIKIRKNPEQHLQEWYAMYLCSKGLLYSATPTGHRSKAAAMAMKRAGYRKGFPDLQILEPRGQWHGMFVELKVGTYAKPYQKEWQCALIAKGYYAIIVPKRFNYQEAQRWLEKQTDKYLKGEVEYNEIQNPL
jgi:hypothetical protein